MRTQKSKTAISKRLQKSKNSRRLARKAIRKKVDPRLVYKIKLLFHAFLINGMSSMEKFIELGESANELKKQVGHGKFLKAINDDLDLDLRLVQRAMKLSRAFNFSEYTNLYYAPRTHLESIMKNSGKMDVMDFLHMNRINLDFNPGEEEELDDFLKAIKNLANQPSRRTAKTTQNSEKEENDKDESDEGENERNKSLIVKPSSQNHLKITPKEICNWANRIRNNRKEQNKLLTAEQVAKLKKAINSIELLIDELGPEKDEEDYDSEE